MKRATFDYYMRRFYINIFSLSNPFFLIFVFPLILSCVSCLTSIFFLEKIEKYQLLVGGGLQQNVIVRACVLQNVKSYRFVWPFFGPIVVDVQEHCKDRYFSAF